MICFYPSDSLTCWAASSLLLLLLPLPTYLLLLLLLLLPVGQHRVYRDDTRARAQAGREHSCEGHVVEAR